MSLKDIAIYWFRQDLRIADNPALQAASLHECIYCIYILDDMNVGDCAMGAASRLWLHHSLRSLNKSLNNKLSLYCGDAQQLLLTLATSLKAKAVYWNRCYEPWRIKRDKAIMQELKSSQIEVHSFNSALLWEPWQNLKKDGTPYRVFTPFYKRGCLQGPSPRVIAPEPDLSSLKKDKTGVSLNDLQLLPTLDWGEGVIKHWSIGEDAAEIRLHEFLQHGIDNYKNGRDYPSLHSVSRLSPYLHFGEISPHQVWHAASKKLKTKDVECFLSELGWREFSYSLIYHFPKLYKKNLLEKFDNFPWKKNKKYLQAWQQGQTGIPIVDAGMRELWQTGYIHNRVRMVVGSFLVKNLLLPWQQGAAWFWDCLVDADLASNSASWQWVAGCGADAAPYFRVFNPVTQGQRFDADGLYTKQYVPELKKMPAKYLFNPWQAPADVLSASGVELGVNYPYPIVDIADSRKTALAAYQTIK